MKYRIKKAMLSMLAMVCGVCMLAGYASANNHLDVDWAYSCQQAHYSTAYRNKTDASATYCKQTDGHKTYVTVYRATSWSGAKEKEDSDRVLIAPGEKKYIKNNTGSVNPYGYVKLYMQRRIADNTVCKGVWSADSTH